MPPYKDAIVPLQWVVYFTVTFLNNIQEAESVCLSSTPCYPPPTDVSVLSSSFLNVSSTCGTPPEQFCTATSCLLCNASSNNDRHPKEFLVDQYSLPTFWKSKNFEAPVYIQVDLGQRLILHQVVITFEFELPNGIYFQSSQDSGSTFRTLVYFARECVTTFSLPVSSGYNGINVVCLRITPVGNTLKRVSYMPRSDSTIATQVLGNTAVRNYFIFTNLKTVLHDYFKPADFNAQTADQRRFYFAIKDFDLQGSCYCNGMSETCDSQTYSKCVCEKNTEGANCERCLPLYNNKAWAFGVACEACTCNSHSSSCQFNATKGYGVCNNCSHNTSGDRCDQCKAGFYRNVTLNISSQYACLDCGCQLSGVVNNSMICNSTTGQCLCKSNVEGRLCSTCRDGFWSLSSSYANGCQACNCRSVATVNGNTVCTKVNGQCQCRQGFTGRTCSVCQNGYYGVPANSPLNCYNCMCFPSGSVNSSCASDGQCYCRPFYTGLKCQNVAVGYYSASIEQLTFSTWGAMIISSASYYLNYTVTMNSRGQSIYYVGYLAGLDTVTGSATTMIFTINLPATTGYEFFLRYLTSFNFQNVSLTIRLQSAFSSYSCIQGSGTTVTITQNIPVVLYSNLMASNDSASFGISCLQSGQYTVTLSFLSDSAASASSVARILVTSLVVLPSYRFSYWYSSVNASVQSQIRYYYNQAQSLILWSLHGSQGIQGSQESQGSFYLSYLFGSVFSSAVPCNCDATGSSNTTVCNQYGGECLCKPNLFGRQCTRCLPSHFNFSSGLGCSACNCHPLGSTNTSCNLVSGQCNCKPNIIGVKCDQCQANYFGLDSGQGCSPCGCSQLYSQSQQCNANGICNCKTGVGGTKCTVCQSGYHNLTTSGCSLCSCNSIGSLNSSCNTLNGDCPCKANAVGSSCDRCKIGHYGFSSQFSDACLKCQCYGKTTNCAVASRYYLTNISTTFPTASNNVNLSGWRSVNERGQRAGTLMWLWAPLYSFTRGYAKLEDTGSNNELFFSAPSLFLGDKRSAYMYKLTFDLAVQNNSSPLTSTMGDVILKGRLAPFTLVTTLSPRPLELSLNNQRFRSYEVFFDEKSWRKNSTNGSVAASSDMFRVLSNLEAIWIRGKWSTVPQRYTGLANVYMHFSRSDNSGLGLSPALNVEQCSCPVGYTGLSCEGCSSGYRREVPYGNEYTNCVKCSCNNHSAICDPSTGICQNCQHRTTGNNCGRCIQGYYGNATQGTPTDCSPCPCPGGPNSTNQFSLTCVLANDGLPNCTACQTGYEGRNCERCVDGYFGNPTVPGGRCGLCNCNNNVNAAVSGNCDRTSGQCLKCIFNTTGFNCEWCRSGYYGNALQRSCRACQCNSIGSSNLVCHNITGQCECKTNVIGLFCDRCTTNTFNFTSGSGCQLCNCNRFGSTSQQCNSVTGNCSCKPRVIGAKCDQCAPGYYDLSRGCLPCSCNSTFTVENTTCDGITGQCVCKKSPRGSQYGGRTCNQCGPNDIGTPPNCEVCHYPCYDNWLRYITQESNNLQILVTNTSNLLAKFGGLTYSQIESQLQYLNGNLTYASNVFERAQYDTRAKETQFRQIETSIVQFQASLNQSESQLRNAELYFQDTSDYNGTVNLYPNPPSSLPFPYMNVQMRTTLSSAGTASAASVTTMAQGYINVSASNNVTGYLLYSTISQRYGQIVTASRSLTQAAADITEAMSRLSLAASERARASGYISQDFQTLFQANVAELQAINMLVQSLQIILNSTNLTYNEATRALSTAQMMIADAQTQTNTRKSEANRVSQLASEMYVSAASLRTNALATQRSAEDLKSSADVVLTDVQSATGSVVTGINKLATVRNITQQARTIAGQVVNTSLPVSLARIQGLVNQITSTPIDEGQINTTLAGAAEGLRRAQDVQQLSQQAVNVSQATLNDIRGVETSLQQAESLRNSTRLVQTSNDVKVNEIKNISATVEAQFTPLRGIGSQTLSLINSTIQEVDSNMMCFINAKGLADNATIVAQEAQNLSTNALRMHRSNTQTLTQYSTQINEAYTTTMARQSEAQQAHGNATQLLNDVTEAERLLAQFVTQRTELEQLQTESASLEAELDDLMTKYNQAVDKYSKCNRN